MRGQLRFDVEVDAAEDLDDLRAVVAQFLRTEHEVTVINEASSYAREPFTLVGAHRNRPGDSWRKVVQAGDEDDARTQVLTEDPTRTINLCVAGDLLPPDPEPEEPAE